MMSGCCHPAARPAKSPNPRHQKPRAIRLLPLAVDIAANGSALTVASAHRFADSLASSPQMRHEASGGRQ